MSDYFNTSAKDESANCLHCGAPITQKKGPGRARKYCGEWHAKLYRRNAVMFYDGRIVNAYPIRRVA
ncbi:hypothetical protein [Streptomyces sp. NPDC056669]|uniref:hypothetical protein n=1 Tax=Streptomyces sp. NPDC056669 TaxID=3345903 RepID=UPI0036A04AA4